MCPPRLGTANNFSFMYIDYKIRIRNSQFKKKLLAPFSDIRSARKGVFLWEKLKR